MLHKTENFPATVLRLFLVYGPHQKNDRLIPQVINGCLKKKKFPVSKGHQLRDFCYVDDVINAIILSLIKKKALGKVSFNVRKLPALDSQIRFFGAQIQWEYEVN